MGPAKAITSSLPGVSGSSSYFGHCRKVEQRNITDGVPWPRATNE
jgi:hypothetical protein